MRVLRAGERCGEIAVGELCIALGPRDRLLLDDGWDLPEGADAVYSAQVLFDEAGTYGAQTYPDCPDGFLPTWGVVSRFPILCGETGWWQRRGRELRLAHQAEPICAIYRPRALCPVHRPLPDPPQASEDALVAMLLRECQADRADWRTRKTLAERLIKANYLHDARALLRETARNGPEMLAAYEDVLWTMLDDPSSDDPLSYCHPLLEELCALRPSDPARWANLAENRLKAMDLNRARAAAEEVRRLRPDDLRAFAVLAEIARRLHDTSNENRLRQEALEAGPDSLNARLGWVSAQRYRASESFMQQMIRDWPYDVRARIGLALHRLFWGGRDRATWELYNWRYAEGKLSGFSDVPPRTPHGWDGRDLNGGTLLVRSEQGYGDSLQFFRYLKQARKSCGQLVLATRPRLERLARISAVADVVVSPHGSPVRCDAECFLMSLPSLLEPSPVDVPYLRADAADVASWRDRLGPSSRKRVGLAWAGNPEHSQDAQRSSNLLAFRPLWTMPGVELHSLQRDTSHACAATEGCVTDMQHEQVDWAAAAALVSLLDLVVTVDSAVAHLAGALGRPVWLLLPHGWAEWRWGDQGETTAWYPTMRIFRMTESEGWIDLVRRVRRALELEWAEAPQDAP